jgi:predicted ATPase/class 3 adenylate cyclase
MSSTLPTGTVTFLFTDIVGSTQLLQQLGADRYTELLADQRAILRAAFEGHNGREIDTQGDSFFVSFPRATEAVAAVVEIQRTLAAHDWPEGMEVRVRMGLHTGEPLVAEEGYVGMDVHRAARIASIGHGGQVLLSEATAALIANNLPAEVTLRDLGEHRLKDLRTPKRIFQLNIAGLPGVLPPLKSGGRPNNLPPQSTPFIGRLAELAALERLIADPEVRLITLLGTGGMGKSRLALAAAEGQLDALQTENGRPAPRFPHGAFFVPLAPLASRDQIVPAIAEALDFRLESRESPASPGQERRSARQQLLDYLHNKQLLLVLDNYEHLLEGARLAVEILETAKGVQVLATSRERLGLQREQVFRLEGMAYPENGSDPAASYSAMTLFENRARLVRTDFAVNGGVRELIGEICRLVGGMPLAIELAAAWVEVLSLADIAAEIQRGLAILETEWGDVAARHRSVTAVFDSTYERLEEEERAVFRKVSVFRDGFTRQAAEEITGASLRILTRLVQKSILHYSLTKDRHEIHELLRQFGAEQLSATPQEQQEIARRHADFFCAAMQTWGEQMHGPQQMKAEEEIRIEIDNILQASAWAYGQKSTAHLDQAVNGLGFYFLRSGQEGPENYFQSASEHLAGLKAPNDRRVWVKVAAWQAIFLWTENNAGGVRLLQQCLEVLDDPDLDDIDTRWERAFVFENLGDSAQSRQSAIAMYQEALTLFRELEDTRGIAYNLQAMAWSAHMTGDKSASYRLFEECLAMWRSLGDQISLANALSNYFWLLATQGRHEAAGRTIQEVVDIRAGLGILERVPHTIGLQKVINYFDGNFQAASENFLLCNNLAEELGQHGTAIWSREMYAECLLHSGNYQQAWAEASQVLGRAEQLNYRWNIAFAHWIIGKANYSLNKLESVNEHLQKAKIIFADEDIELTHQAEISMVILPVGSWDATQIWEIIKRSLQGAIKRHTYLLTLTTLSAAVMLLIDKGSILQAVELHELTLQHGHIANSQFYADTVGRRVAEAAEGLPVADITAAKACGRERDLWETAEELLQNLSLE